MKEPLLKPDLLETRQARPHVATLQACGFASAESGFTGKTARVESQYIAVGDVVI